MLTVENFSVIVTSQEVCLVIKIFHDDYMKFPRSYGWYAKYVTVIYQTTKVDRIDECLTLKWKGFFYNYQIFLLFAENVQVIWSLVWM